MAEEEKKATVAVQPLDELAYKPPKRMSLHTKNADDAALEKASALEKMTKVWGDMYEQILDEGK